MQWPWTKAETELEREMRYHFETLADGFERCSLYRSTPPNSRRARCIASARDIPSAAGRPGGMVGRAEICGLQGARHDSA